MLSGKRIVLGISGSIASYKAADVASRLTQAGALVHAVMTPAATRFITPLAIRSLTRQPVFVDMFDTNSELAEQHVELARRADAVLVAPATADCIARLAHGLADDVLALTVLAATAPVLVAPAMDAQMWANAATQANVRLLEARGVRIVGPAEGRLASGRSGAGRLESAETLLGALTQALGSSGDFSGLRIVVTAGGTKEPIDPVRYIGNHSSGKMGYALAQAARDRGASVTLVTAPAALPDPYGVRVVPAPTARAMLDAVLSECRSADALIMAAAVADFRPRRQAEQKIKKRPGEESWELELETTDDILEALCAAVPEMVRVGFAAESEDLLDNAAAKLHRKGLALIAANDITAADAGFGVDTNRVTILDREGHAEELPLLSKYDVAHRLLDRLRPLLEPTRVAGA